MYTYKEHITDRQKADIYALNYILKAIPVIKEVLKESDGKPVNKHFDNKFKKRGLATSGAVYHGILRCFINNQGQDLVHTDIEGHIPVILNGLGKIDYQETEKEIDKYYIQCEKQLEKVQAINEGDLIKISNEIDSIYKKINDFNNKYGDSYSLSEPYLDINYWKIKENL